MMQIRAQNYKTNKHNYKTNKHDYKKCPSISACKISTRFDGWIYCDEIFPKTCFSMSLCRWCLILRQYHF